MIFEALQTEKGFLIDAYMMALLTNQIVNGCAPPDHRAGFKHQYENLPELFGFEIDSLGSKVP